jgi:hypothetical protein
MNANEHTRAAVLALALILIVPCFAYGDKIELKNGQVFEGSIIREEDKRIQLKLDGSGARLWFSRDQILSIEKSSIPEVDSVPEDVPKARVVDPDDDEARAHKLLDSLKGRSVVEEKKKGVPASPFLGAANAAVTIEVFSDYQ